LSVGSGKIAAKLVQVKGVNATSIWSQRERGMLLDLGITRSTEQLLDMAGAPSAADEDSEVSVRDRANGDQLRSILPVQSWLPLNVHLIGLSEGF
jgi:general secretion pathway protein E